MPIGNNASVSELYQRYQHDAGNTIDMVVPYEERPPPWKRADAKSEDLIRIGTEAMLGDGLVLVVHAQLDEARSNIAKTTVCSGFVVDAQSKRSDRGDIILTCAHTLEEMYRSTYRASSSTPSLQQSFSIIIPSAGPPRLVTTLLSSMPRADCIVLETRPTSTTPQPRLRPLPLTPFPVYTGTPILTHLFGSPDPPPIHRSIARAKFPSASSFSFTSRFPRPSPLETPIPFPINSTSTETIAYRRWALGSMLGYRSYTGLEIEAGISSVLPHILTSILPTPGSSGGPLVNGETGCVVGMISGRRMDNRVEGERGWGCSAEMVFEMFSLPGFTPAGT